MNPRQAAGGFPADPAYTQSLSLRQRCLPALRAQLAFPAEVFVALVEPLLRGVVADAELEAVERPTCASLGSEASGRAMVICLRALAVRRERILPPNAMPEAVGDLAHRWTYALLVAALLRDGSSAPGPRFEFVVPESGRRWLREDPEVSKALTSVLAGSAGIDNPIEAILREARGASVAQACFCESVEPAPAPEADQAAATVAVGVVAAGSVETSFAQPLVPVGHGAEFLAWVRDGLADGSFEINTRLAFVHGVADGLLLVWPDAFRSFLEAQGALFVSPRALRRLRHALWEVGWHLRAPRGVAMHEYERDDGGQPSVLVSGVVITATERLTDRRVPINPSLVRMKASTDSGA